MALNPFETGVTYSDFLKELGKKDLKMYLKKFNFNKEEIEFLKNELETYKNNLKNQ